MASDRVANEFILTMTCPDRTGIVAATAGCLAEMSCFVTEAAHFGDPESGRFFGRIQFRIEAGGPPFEDVEARLAEVAADLEMDWKLRHELRKHRVLIMVSRLDHCLDDLLYRYRSGALDMDISAIVSNHPDLEPLARADDLPFHHFPITPETKPEQEAKWLALVEETKTDLVVLARYMQILTPETSARLLGRCINIHHSFLPGFKGARPYHQAHDRGVKIIGATAHFVTDDLDEGPIIEQGVERVDHTHTPAGLTAVGRDLECMVLARAVKYFLERRVLLNGTRTVVFK